MLAHEGAFGVEGGIGRVDGAAAQGGRLGSVVVRGEDDEAWGGAIGGLVDVGHCASRGEKVDVGGWVEVGMDVDEEGRRSGGKFDHGEGGGRPRVDEKVCRSLDACSATATIAAICSWPVHLEILPVTRHTTRELEDSVWWGDQMNYSVFSDLLLSPSLARPPTVPSPVGRERSSWVVVSNK